MPDGAKVPSGICCLEGEKMKLKELLCTFRRLWRGATLLRAARWGGFGAGEV